MKVGIVGSRRRNGYRDMQYVLKLVEQLKRNYPVLELVSGACPKGADDFAATAARLYGVKIKEFPVGGAAHKGEFVQKAYARNRQIAEYSDVIYALVHSDRTGGTENTIKHAHDLEKTVYIVDDSGQIYLEGEAVKDRDP